MLSREQRWGFSARSVELLEVRGCPWGGCLLFLTPFALPLAPWGQGPRQGGMMLENPQLEEALRSSQQGKPLVATPPRWGAGGGDH